MNRIREDIHIHASVEAVYGHLAALEGHGRWLPRSFREVAASASELSFDLALPLRRERARLSVTGEEAPGLLVLEGANGGDGAAGGCSLVSLTWALHPESAAEAHLTLEAAYHPAGGPLALLEPVLYEPLRRQAFRDALWRLKQFVERGGLDLA